MTPRTPPLDAGATRVLDFWFRELTPGDWFGGGAQLDEKVCARFGAVHAQALEGACDGWAETPLGRLALVIVLDQFSRHIHRDTAQAFAADRRAQELVLEGLEAGVDALLGFAHRHFFYMPLMHAEDTVLQARSVACFEDLNRFAGELLAFARSHEADIAAYGRFPYRNAALQRRSTNEEEDFLKTRQGP